MAEVPILRLLRSKWTVSIWAPIGGGEAKVTISIKASAMGTTNASKEKDFLFLTFNTGCRNVWMGFEAPPQDAGCLVEAADDVRLLHHFRSAAAAAAALRIFDLKVSNAILPLRHRN